MLTRMTEEDWGNVLGVFDTARSRCGEPGHNDRKGLQALHFFHRPQHHVVGSAGGVRLLERNLEAVLGSQSLRCV